MALLLSVLGQLEEAITVDSIARCRVYSIVSMDGSLANRGRRRNTAAEEGVDVVAENVAAVNKQMDAKVDVDVVEVDVRSFKKISPILEQFVHEHNDPDGI